MSHVLQNVVFPLDRDPDLLPLYVDPETWSTIDDTPVRVSNVAHLGNVLGRHRARIVAGRRVSFGTYFNAFPASYWQHWTVVSEVTLTVETTGPATVLVYRSTEAGVSQRLDTREVRGQATTQFTIPLDRYSGGGWIWFDVVADAEDAFFEGGRWSTEQEPARDGQASLGITTFDKPEYCLDTLRSLADAPEALEVVDRVFIVDQGTRKVAATPGYTEVAERLGDTLQIVDQPNLGGSGGFARAMLETLDRPASAFVQILDDDVRIEPESIRRSVVFGRYTTAPTIVGAHMFDLLDRPKLHAWAEVVDEHPFMWRTLRQEQMPHDFGRGNLRQTPMLHQRLDADYNGWWMCLIPTSVIERIGLPLPLFIKWDDAEYALRAREAGVSTVSLPGVALWHVSWVGKDDTIDWQAYFHARNRIVAGLLHSRAPRGGSLPRHSRRVDLKHLMMMQYYPVALRHRALADVLRGPGNLWDTLATAMPAARALAAEFPETTLLKDDDLVVRSRLGRQVYPVTTRPPRSPQGIALRAFTLRTLLSHWFHRPAERDLARPEVEFGKSDAHWWRVPTHDSALISSADGAGKNFYARDRRRFRRMLRDSIRLHRRLVKEWDGLQLEYQTAAPSLTSVDAWREHLDLGRARTSAAPPLES